MSAANNIARVQEYSQSELGIIFNSHLRIHYNSLNGSDFESAAYAKWTWKDSGKYIFTNMGIAGGFIFSDGSSDGKKSPYTTLDIVAHEYGHALSDSFFVADGYGDEVFALNESYSDIFATLVEYKIQTDEPSIYLNMTGSDHWLFGEDVVTALNDNDALRDLSNPQRLGGASYYQGTSWFANSGFHARAGVQNFAFYLLSEGGSGDNEDTSYDINGIGIDIAREIVLLAWQRMPVGGDFKDSLTQWGKAAVDLGLGQDGLLNVINAWRAVGVELTCEEWDAIFNISGGC